MNRVSTTGYVFFGTSYFSVIVLRKLLEAGFIPRAAVCSPDKPVGKKQILTPPPIKQEIVNNGWDIEILQPEMIDEAFLDKLKSLGADFYIVAAYGKILPEKLLKIPLKGVIGVHPSLLPKFRGPSPIQGVLLEGARETGVTLFKIDEKVDHGPIIASWKITIAQENYEILEEKVANLSGDLLIATLPEFIEGKITPQPQNEAEATYTKKFSTQDAYVSPEILEAALNGDLDKAEEIERMTRALNPEPGVWTMKDGKRVKILEVKIVDSQLKLVKIQEAGKKPVLLA